MDQFNLGSQTVTYRHEDNSRNVFNMSPATKDTSYMCYNSPNATPSKASIVGKEIRSRFSLRSNSDKVGTGGEITPFNFLNSSQPKFTLSNANSNVRTSPKTQDLPCLLPPITFQEEDFERNNDLCFLGNRVKSGLDVKREGKRCEITTHKISTSQNETLLSSPAFHDSDLAIDKNFLTSDPENCDNHLYPWLLKQEYSPYASPISGDINYGDDFQKLKSNSTETKRMEMIWKTEDDSKSPRPDNSLNSQLDPFDKSSEAESLSFEVLPEPKSSKTKIFERKETGYTRQVKESRIEYFQKRYQNKVSNSKPVDTDDQFDYKIPQDTRDEKFLPRYKMTRSRSKKSQINLKSYAGIQDKKRKLGPRSKSGCWTCRVRHKACPEEKPRCSQCVRLNLKCDYSTSRPKYMTDPTLQVNKLREIRNITFKQKKKNFTKSKH